jgi:hypothetical protein
MSKNYHQEVPPQHYLNLKDVHYCGALQLSLHSLMKITAVDHQIPQTVRVKFFPHDEHR